MPYRLLYFSDLALCWWLLLDRVYGPRIKMRLRNATLDEDFCARVANDARAELWQLL